LTGKINWDYSKDINIDDVWRQAYSLYKSGFKYELTAEEIRENELANRQYQVTTVEMEWIQKTILREAKKSMMLFIKQLISSTIYRRNTPMPARTLST